MDRGPPPGERIRDQAVLDGIVVDVIDVAGEIVIVADQMLPEPPLPELIFAPLVTGERNPVTSQRPAEASLDGAPAVLVIGVAGRQGPQGVQVIGKHDDRVNGKGALAPHAAQDLPQELGSPGEKIGPPVAQGDGEEVRSAGDAGAPVADHAAD
jgi:hypothetical protein